MNSCHNALYRFNKTTIRKVKPYTSTTLATKFRTETWEKHQQHLQQLMHKKSTHHSLITYHVQSVAYHTNPKWPLVAVSPLFLYLVWFIGDVSLRNYLMACGD